MTIQYSVYDTSSGEVLRTGSCLTLAQAQLQASEPGTAVITTGVDPNAQAINTVDGSIINRGFMQANGQATAIDKTSFLANSTDMVTISNVPVGATYIITIPIDQGLDPVPNGTVNDGVLQITTNVKGAYTVTLRYSNFFDFTAHINAT